MDRVFSQSARMQPRNGARIAGLLLAAGVLIATSGALANDDAILTELEPTSDRAALTLSKSGAAQDVLRRIEIERGKSVVLMPDFGVKRISVGDPTVADVIVLSPREFHLVGKTIGDTNVVVWDSSGHLQAAIDLHVGTPHSQIQAELIRVLGNDTIRVDAAGAALVLKGTVQSPADMDRAIRVAKAFFGGSEDSAATADARVINMLKIGGNQQVMIEITVAEMSRTVLRELGTNWAGTTPSGSNSVFRFGFLTGLQDAAANAGSSLAALGDNVNFAARIMKGSDQLDVFLQAVQQDGLAKILAEPTLTARSGEPAQFLVGGEIPIPIPQTGLTGMITVEFKEFGVGVKFTPTVMSSDRVHLKVSTEVSEPDLQLGTTLGGIQIPAFQTRRAATAVELGDGESFAIAGLLRDDVSELVQEFPWVAEIPVLGALFRSTQFEKNETELVIIVRPRLVKPMTGTPTLPTDFFVEPNSWEFFFLGQLEGIRLGRALDSADNGLVNFLDMLKIDAHDGEPSAAGSLADAPASTGPEAQTDLAAELDPWAHADPIAGDSGHRVPFLNTEENL